MKIPQIIVLALTVIMSVGATRFIDGFGNRSLQNALDTLASNEILRRATDSLRWDARVAVVTDDMSRSLSRAAGENDSLTARTIELVASIESLSDVLSGFAP